MVKVSASPFALSQPHQSGDTVNSPRDPIPWLGTHVRIIQTGHSNRGYQAVIKSVLCGQDTLSGMRVAVQLLHYDPSNPFPTILCDYDSIVEIRYLPSLLFY